MPETRQVRPGAPPPIAPPIQPNDSTRPNTPIQGGLPGDRLLSRREFAEQAGFQSGDRITPQTGQMLTRSYMNYASRFREHQFRLDEGQERALQAIQKETLRQAGSRDTGRKRQERALTTYGKLLKLRDQEVEASDGQVSDPDRQPTRIEQSAIWKETVAALFAAAVQGESEATGVPITELGRQGTANQPAATPGGTLPAPPQRPSLPSPPAVGVNPATPRSLGPPPPQAGGPIPGRADQFLNIDGVPLDILNKPGISPTARIARSIKNPGEYMIFNPVTGRWEPLN